MRNIALNNISKTALLIGALMLAPHIASTANSQIPSLRSSQSEALTIDHRGVLTMAPLLERVTPAVVSIEVITKSPKSNLSAEKQELYDHFFGKRSPKASSGSGVILDAGKGYVITNHHVVENAAEINLTLSDDRSVEAKIVGTDEKTDLAILKIDAKDLTDMRRAPAGAQKVGDYVIAIGNPFGFDHTVTSGIISGVGREFGRRDGYQDFIQTDASINPGNSGGALINSKGELIGINTMIYSRSGGNQGIGFAVPIKIVEGVMKQILEHGEVKRGRIGVSIRSIDEALEQALDLPNRNGALINQVSPDSAAEAAGLQEGDVIIEFNGEKIYDSNDIRNAVGLVPAGTTTEIVYLRDGRVKKSPITVEAFEEERTELDDEAIEELPELERFEGATLTEIPEDFETRGGDEGVYISRVRPLSKAARAGLIAGDIIRKVNRKPVSDLESFQEQIKAKSGPLALSVERKGSNIFIAVR